MRIYTRRGDRGEAALLGGKRLSKGDLLFEAIGDVDELNAHLGYSVACLSRKTASSLIPVMEKIQRQLFQIGADLATSSDDLGTSWADVELLEKEIDRLESRLTPLAHFILPGGHRAAAAIQIARTVARRAERSTVRIAEHRETYETIVAYLNRLSDFLFVAARFVNAVEGVDEPLWTSNK